ncbi:M28 family peptidase [Fimbriimonas ginsengisoli]|uniref:Putative aminopeptidase n=1 Tax=Fimbriimonas ginsengisoli Gsoil 348 TaxID=661478 RepID=A0A068NQF9_FIMGI|nr:M28 family peptidase [Fimbriimonas ginsengisoli]AIE85656.1 putative aminopeptidase [Fimbriimonas ginsengisoli Gsoil 348]
MRRSTVLFALLLGSSLGFGQAKFGNEKAISPARLKAHLEFIASDEMEGRDTPSRGLDTATLYVATQLKLWGAKPAGDHGTFFQRIPLTQHWLDTADSSIAFGGTDYTFGEGFKSASKSWSGAGKLVYVGHGYMFKSKGIDPYKGIDVKGKILVAVSGFPADAAYSDMKGKPGVDYMWPALAAQKLGALGLVTIPDGAYLSRWNAVEASAKSGLAPESESDPASVVPSLVAGISLTNAIFSGEKVTAEQALMGKAPEKSFDFASSKTLRVHIVQKRAVQYARNVVAIVPGSDARLKNEYVAFGAHIDHLGMATDGTGDRIFNGADDDGSGTVSILEIAHAFLTGPHPKRSCLFVWHIGEEKGLWGSAYFTEHPTVNLKKVITQLNIDMIGRSRPAGDKKPANAVLTGPNEIYAVGSTKMSTDLQRVSESVNRQFLRLKFNYKYDDPKDTEQIFYRSDHYNYAHKGIPIIFYFDGVHEDYHQPSDEVTKIDFVKMSRVVRTVYATGWTLANAAKRPVVDKPLKE